MFNTFLHSFWFHMLVAAGIMAMGLWLGIARHALIFNTAFWPFREFMQKALGGNWRGFFTWHVWLEWAMPLAVGFAVYEAAK